MNPSVKRLRLLFSAVLVFGVCVGCDGKKDATPRAAPKTLLLHCGAGIRPPAAELAEIFGKEHGVKVETNYAGSEVLLSNIRLHKRGDLYMPGDKNYVDLAAKEGLVVAQQSACYFVPTILVQKGNPKKIAGLRDLVRSGVKLGLGDAKACAIGRQCKRIFEKNKIPWTDVERTLTFQSLTVNELGMQIQARSLDAVIVWDAIAAYYAEHGEQVPIPPEQNIISTVAVGVLTFAKDKDLASRFVAFAASDRGRAIFKKHHYRVDPPGEARR